LLLQTLLANADMNRLICALNVNNTVEHSSSLKFGKLMLSTIAAYGSKVPSSFVSSAAQYGVVVSKRVKGSIIVFKMRKSLRGHYTGLGERTVQKMSLEVFPRDSHWRRRRDVLWGRVFHSREAATGKGRSPTVERRVRWTTSDDDESELRRWWASTSDGWWNSSVYSFTHVISSLTNCCGIFYVVL